MSEAPAHLVARHVHDLIERQRLDGLPDHALLHRFLDGEEAAFAALVRRHGPLVLGTCRRILRHTQDAEDACQAVFLVLARRGRTVRGGSLAGWLHRVAVRAANRLRRQLAQRTAEPLSPDAHAPAPTGDELVRHEVRQAVDTEVGRLPDRFRLPVVLCCLQGKSRSEAAAELGWTEGTVRGRLERGRKVLRSRFTRRGLTLPATLLPLLVERAAPATTPADLVSPSTLAARLADGVVRSMAVARTQLAAWATAAVLVVGTGVGVGLYRPAGAQPRVGQTPPAAPPPTAAHAERNLDTFTLRVSLAPTGEDRFHEKYSLYHVLLHVPNLRLEPPANGPDGKPVEAHARITREQAKKIVDALGGFDFFKDDSAFHDPMAAKLQLMNLASWPHVGLAVRFQNGEDASRVARRLAWLPSMLPPLDAVRGCVDGEGAKALDQLLAQLAEDRKRWAPDPVADAVKKLQGTWEIDPKELMNRDGRATETTRCVIDGKNITLKPRIQLLPHLDLESIRGTFELPADKPGRMVVKGVRDTISKQESGTWTLLYEVSDTTLRLLLPPAGAAPPAMWKASADKGVREFTLKRMTPGIAFEWGEASNHLQARLRTQKVKYAAGEIPAFELDVRDIHPGIAGKPWHWQAPRIGQLARVEVDGVWYEPSGPVKKVVYHPLRFGESIESWATVHLTDDYWMREGDEGRGTQWLALKPGRHRVRVAYDFAANEGGHTAKPITGVIEFEVVAGATPRASDWGKPSNGLQARVRAPATVRAGGPFDIQLDVRADRDRAGRWRAPRAGRHARVEVDGEWFVYNLDTFEKVVLHDLAAGAEVAAWAVVRLSRDWVGEEADKTRVLNLRPGKHTIRVEFPFQPDSRPVSGLLEIEVAEAAKAPTPVTGGK